MSRLQEILAEDWGVEASDILLLGPVIGVGRLRWPVFVGVTSSETKSVTPESRALVAALGKRALAWMITQGTCGDCYHECWCEHHETEWTAIQDEAKKLT